MEIQNTLDCFVLLWRMLERTRRLLQGHCKRFCIRNVLKAWFDCEAKRTVAGYRRRQTWYRYAKSGTQGTGSGL